MEGLAYTQVVIPFVNEFGSHFRTEPSNETHFRYLAVSESGSALVTY
jgi:hypothetical protein